MMMMHRAAPPRVASSAAQRYHYYYYLSSSPSPPPPPLPQLVSFFFTSRNDHHHHRYNYNSYFSSSIINSSHSQLQFRRRRRRRLRCTAASAACAATINIQTPAVARERNYNSSATQLQQQHQQQQQRKGMKRAARVKSFLSSGPLPYETGWAWQQALLNRRLEYLRQGNVQNQQQLVVPPPPDPLQHHLQHRNRCCHHNDDEDYDDHNNHDWILLFEHQPVYTLGRGASEDHLNFLRSNTNHGDDDGDESITDAMKMEYRRRLARTYRGDDASRLTADFRSSKRQQQQECTAYDIVTSIEEEVSRSLQQQQQHEQQQHPSPVLAPNGAPIYRIERGGEVTFHGPGQLVIYPLLHLQHPAYRRDLHWYLRRIEEVVIRTLAAFDIASHRDAIHTGVWVEKEKIAAVGVSSSRWITSHGLALNVSTDLSYFDKGVIAPCGIREEEEGRGVTSMANILKGRRRRRRQSRQALHNMGVYDDDDDDDDENVPLPHCPTVEEVAEVALQCFGNVFGIDLLPWDEDHRMR